MLFIFSLFVRICVLISLSLFVFMYFLCGLNRMFLLFTICQLLVIPFKGAFQVKKLKCEKIHMLVSAETHVWFHQVRYNLDDVYGSDTQEGT